MKILIIFSLYLFAICSLNPQQGYLLATNEEVELEKDYELRSTAEKLQQAIFEEKSKEIDSYIQYTMEEQKIPGLALAITYKGEILKKNIYGLASIEYQVPVTDSSVFWLASVSKHITCSAIMLLVQDGIIDIDDNIHKYLPDAPEHWQGITIRHLMTHTSGLPESGKGSERGERSARGTYSAEEMFDNAKKDSLAFKPGTDFLYSDEGIFLLGYIIHRVSGMSFKEFIQQRIFDSSGMNTAYLMDHFTIHPNQVTGYAKKNGQVIPDRNYWRLVDTEINAAGGVYATIDDMISWERILCSDGLLTPESKKLMWTSHSLNDGTKTFYGFGWNTQTINGKKIIYHPGIAGTEFLRFVDDKISIIVITNQANYQRSMAHKISEILEISPEKSENEFISGQISKSVPGRKDIEKLIGEYNFIPNGNYSLDNPIRISIISEKDKLWIIYPSNQKYNHKYQLAKMNNGRWVQLSWDPIATEFSYEIKEENDKFRIAVFENYRIGNSEYIGDLLRIK